MNRDDPLVRIPIEKWTVKFVGLYEDQDISRLPEHFWTAVMAHVSIIGEEIRKLDYYEILQASANVFCWMCCYVAKCNQNVDPIFEFQHTLPEIVALKYPDVCGHCESSPCSCNPFRMDRTKDKAAKYQGLLEKWKEHTDWPQWTARKFINMFWKLFSGKIHIQPLESIGFHLLEEAGEEAQAVRRLIQFRGILDYDISGIDRVFLKRITTIPNLVEEYDRSIAELKKKYQVNSEKEAKEAIDSTSNEPEVVRARLVLAKMDFAIELADTFSWFCAVLLKVENALRRIHRGTREHLDESQTQRTGKKIEKDLENYVYFELALCKRYQIKTSIDELACYMCKKKKCKCRFFPEVETKGSLTNAQTKDT